MLPMSCHGIYGKLLEHKDAITSTLAQANNSTRCGIAVRMDFSEKAYEFQHSAYDNNIKKRTRQQKAHAIISASEKRTRLIDPMSDRQ